MTTGNVPDLNYLLEEPESAPVLVLSNSLGTALEMWDDPRAVHIASVEQPETVTRLILDHLEAR